MKFELTEEESERASKWLMQKQVELAHKQVLPECDIDPGMKQMVQMSIDQGNPSPYLGAIGGGTTYSFTPTSLGTIVKVKYLKEELDLTDYDMW